MKGTGYSHFVVIGACIVIRLAKLNASSKETAMY